MRSASEIVNDLRAAPDQWVDTAIVVVFHDRFEFVREDCPDAASWLHSLEDHGGLAIGLAGIKPTEFSGGTFLAKVFEEYEGQAWAHQHMSRLRTMVRGRNSL